MSFFKAVIATAADCELSWLTALLLLLEQCEWRCLIPPLLLLQHVTTQLLTYGLCVIGSAIRALAVPSAAPSAALPLHSPVRAALVDRSIRFFYAKLLDKGTYQHKNVARWTRKVRESLTAQHRAHHSDAL